MLKHEKVVRLFAKSPSLSCSNQNFYSNAPVLARFQGGVKLNSDIRIAVGFLDHPKTIKLRRRLGWEGFESLLRLWFWAAQYRPDGVFNDMTDEDIEIAAQWSNDRSTFVTTLVELRLLDVDNNVYSLHKWVDRNGYAASANDRSDKSRFARMAKTNRAIYEELKEKGVDSISAEDYRRLTTVQRPLNETLTERISPLPSPSPLPLPSNNPPISPQGGKGEKSPRFKPPTVEEVCAYCEERGNGIDAGSWVDWYASKGWMVGKNKMKDWKAAVRTWEQRNDNAGSSQPAWQAGAI